MYRIQVFIIFLSLPFWSSAQNYYGDIYLRTQAEVDSFDLRYPPMSRLFGGLVIGELPNSNIHDLSSLPHFSAMTELLIRGTQLTSLESFAGVDSTYVCRIIHNPLLQDLRGLNHLKRNTEYFRLYDNPSLTSLVGLDSFQYSHTIVIDSNYNLLSLEGAPQMSQVDYLTISKNKRLRSLTGLPLLSRIFFFTVQANDSLEHFGGFPQLKSLSNVYILSNPRLKDFVGFNNGLRQDADYVEIQDNAALESLAGLEQLAEVGSILYIKNNHLLRQVLHLDSLKTVFIAEISGDLIDTIQFPAMQWGTIKIHDCPSLVRLHNVFPVADSIRWDVYDNTALLSIHEDAGPKKLLRFNASGPLLQSVTGFDSTLLCAGRFHPLEPYEGIGISSPNLREVVGFRNARAGKLGIGRPYATQPMERVEGFDRMETLLGGLTYYAADSNGNYQYQRGIQVLRGFQNLRRCIDGPVNLPFWVQDTMIGFQLLDSIVGRSSIANVGWADTCYVEPQAFSRLSFTEAQFWNGGVHGRPWPVPLLQKVYRSVLHLGGDPQPNGFEGIFPALRTVGGVFAWNSNISSLRGLEGITLFYREAGSPPPFVYLENNPNLNDCSTVCSWLQNATFYPGLPIPNMVITNNPLFPCSDKATLLSWCDTVTAVQAPLPSAADLKKSGELLVYPNPVQQGTLYFRLPKSALGQAFQVTVYDLLGRVKVIRTDQFTTDYALSVEDWPSGAYVLQVQTQEQVWAATVQVGQGP